MKTEIILSVLFAFLNSSRVESDLAVTFEKPRLYEPNNASIVCSPEFFNHDVAAVRSCMAAFALQHNWYPSPIAGLFSYQTWNGFDGFWQDGTVLETLANWMHYGKNTMYKSVITGSVRDVYTLLEAYYPQPSYDDMAWYGISYARIHEVLGSDDPSDQYSNFLYEARQIYDWIWNHGWDNSTSCSGGFWFDQNNAQKQTVENAQMLLLGAKLYRLSNDTNLLEKVKMTWNYINNNELICNATHLVADGATGNCTSNQVFGPTYNMGLMIGGLVEVSRIFPNQSNDFINLAHKIAMATINNSTKNGVIVEYCSPTCNDDEKMFKGIFIRNLRYLIDYTRETKDSIGMQHLHTYLDFIQLNSDTVWSNNRCEPSVRNCSVIFKDGRSLRNNTVGPVFGVDFPGPYNYSAPMQQTAVLDLFVSGILPNTTCNGAMCSFDPPIPPPHPLTCQDNPCPSDQPCCEFQNEFYTCCESTQQCQNGECV